jgi:hypothetical protein
MNEKSLSDLIDQKINEWKKSQENQTDGYEYERSFSEMMQNIGKQILQDSVGEIPENKNLKKTLNLIRIRNSNP